MVTRLQIAKPDIEAYFSNGPTVLRERDIAHALEQQRTFWRLAKSTSVSSFIEFLLSKSQLRRVSYPFPQRPVVGFTWGRVPVLESLQALAEGYYTHYTAVQVHGLTEQTPKVLYLTTEKSKPVSWEDEEEKEPYPQESIDAAFRRPPRVSQNSCQVGALRIVHLTSAYHAAAGVIGQQVNLGDEGVVMLRVTNLERTLIDIAVRPFYAGGVSEVMRAYQLARNRELSVNKMAAMLQKMAFGYPYHQAIGFYLERAGFRPALVDIFRRFPKPRDFYLAYEMGQTEYVPGWRLHIPKGL